MNSDVFFEEESDFELSEEYLQAILLALNSKKPFYFDAIADDLEKL